MAVNLSKNGPALMAAYKDVVDGKSDTNWALFTYEGNSNDIRLSKKGDGGLEEMVEELNSGKVMYAFCRIQEPNSGLPKYVLINWMGDGVKDSRKGLCANHLTSMSNFLKGAHVTINARAEDDVDPEDILKKVAKASGIHFNFNKQTQERRDALPGPVGSVYRKVNAVEEIQQTSKNDFWDQAEREEKIRRREETQRLEEERRTREKERTETEERQSMERERKTRERAQQIEREKTYQRQREEEEREREQQRQGAHVTINARVEDGVDPEDILKKSSEVNFSFNKQTQERRDALPGPVGSVYRKVNAVEEIQQTSKNDFWDQAEREEKIRRREETQRLEEERRTREKERTETEERQSMERERKTRERAQQIEREKTYQRQREEEEREREQQRQTPQDDTSKRTGINFTASVQKANEAKSLIAQRSINPRDVFKQRQQSFEVNGDPSPAAHRPGKLQSPFLSQRSLEMEQPQYPPWTFSTHLSPASPVRSYSPAAPVSPAPAVMAGSPLQAADPVYEEESSDEFDEDADESTREEDPSQDDIYEALPSTQTAGEEDLYENVHTSIADDNTKPDGQEQEVSAVALYDYQAVDGSEINFDPGDIITGIEMLDEGWWRGFGPGGHWGMFPANYVQLL